MTNISVDSREGLVAISLDNGVIRLALLPELGGKIVSLVRVGSSREYLISLASTQRSFRPLSYGGMFVDYNNVGFDECIPTIAACQYPGDSYRGRQLPDHGDVWSLPWHYDMRGEELWLSVEGRSLPYVLRKRLGLKDCQLAIHYELQNKGDAAFHYLWSAHPLLNTEPGARILLPPEVRKLLIDSSHGNRLGSKGDSCAWPIAIPRNGKPDDLSVMKPRGSQSDKLYTARLRNGYCGLYYPSTNESILFRFDPERVPYVGMWICHGGGAADDPKQPYTVALEPCVGRPDSLAEAMARQESDILAPHDLKQWTVHVELREGVVMAEQLGAEITS
jgi:galactose mutarotase-like enzyme